MFVADVHVSVRQRQEVARQDRRAVIALADLKELNSKSCQQN